MPDETTVTLNDAIAWCLEQRDSGTRVSEQEAIETFPQYADEIRSFLRDERKVERALAQPVNGGRTSLPPRTFGKYELRRTVGTGAFGQVFLAWDTEMHRDVALKMARFVCNDGQTRNRFLHEARASSQLRHENIVRTYDFGDVDGTAYLALEFIDGKPLSNWAQRPVPPSQATQMILAIVDALVHAHEQGIVHRDLTPKNIMVDEANSPKILDFGLAKLVLSQTTLCLEGKVVGTPAYVSPEQVTGKAHEVDGRSDTYSVGVILYELLAGERPLDGPLDLLLHRIRFETPTYLADVDPTIPRRLADICKKCLEKSPENRYATAAALRADLQSFLDSKPIPIRTGSRRGSRLNRMALATGMLVIGGLLFSAFHLNAREPNVIARSSVAEDYTDLNLGLTLVSENPNFDDGGQGWLATEDHHPLPADCVTHRTWTPDPANRSESALGQAYISLPDQDEIGFKQRIHLDADTKYQVLTAYGAKQGGWANFGVTYYEVVDGIWNEIRVIRQQFRGPTESPRGEGDGMTLHRIGCEVPERASRALVWVWQQEAGGSALNVDGLALYDYDPVDDKSPAIDQFTIGGRELIDR